jgi:hypothetical protein
MTKTQTEPIGVNHRPSREAAVEDYAWRFRLVRSTLEDFNQLIEDKSARSGAKPQVASLPAEQREIPRPGVTLARPRLAAMNA